MYLPLDPVCVAVIGVGDISEIYLKAIARSPILTLAGVAASRPESAQRAAASWNVQGFTVDQALADDTVELIVNLAPARFHEEINARVLRAGKHLYSEKPVALSREGATDLAELAERHGKRIGGAPDTFFGAAHQASRALLDSGKIGAPTIGTAFVGHRGIEWFHPSPMAFYQPGAELPFDIGPYHILQWVNLLGPVKQVFASASAGSSSRVAMRGPAAGEAFAVAVPTSFNIIMMFERASVSLVLSLDVLDFVQRPSELFGTDGVLFLSDPNFFGGEPAVSTASVSRHPIELDRFAFGQPNSIAHDGRPIANYRGIGLVEMALCLRTGRAHRTSAQLLIHIAEVSEAIMRSTLSGQSIEIISNCDRPLPLGTNPSDMLLGAAMPS